MSRFRSSLWQIGTKGWWTLSIMIVALLVVSLLEMNTATGVDAAGSLPGTIAYSTGSSVRLIEPDGSNDRLLWSSPFPDEIGIPNVEWNHAGTEVAFISGHEASVSFYERDIYAVRPDGSGYRKLTNAPGHGELADYPKGTVTVDVYVAAGGGGPYLVYVSGAAEPQAVTGAGTWHLTFENVADFGAMQQPVVAIEGAYRWFNTATADVQAGQTVHAGILTISGDGFWHFGVHENKLTWRSDDSRLGFIFGAGCQIKETSAQPPAGWPLIEPNVWGYTCLVDWAPLAARANQVLYTEANYFTGEGHIYLTEEGSSAAGEPIINYALPATILDLEWLPDGLGLLFSFMDEFDTNANIYSYIWNATEVTQLTFFSDEFAGRFSVSPDGQHVVFERASDPEGSVDLWLMRSDGTEMQLLVSNAGRPSWGAAAAAPPPVGGERAYLPVLKRP